MCQFQSSDLPESSILKQPLTGYKVLWKNGASPTYSKTLRKRKAGIWFRSKCGENPWPSHLSPEPFCGCGFHVWKKKRDASNYMKAFVLNGVNEVSLWKVEIKGRIVQYDDGWRAQFMKILPSKTK